MEVSPATGVGVPVCGGVIAVDVCCTIGGIVATTEGFSSPSAAVGGAVTAAAVVAAVRPSCGVGVAGAGVGGGNDGGDVGTSAAFVGVTGEGVAGVVVAAGGVTGMISVVGAGVFGTGDTGGELGGGDGVSPVSSGTRGAPEGAAAGAVVGGTVVVVGRTDSDEVTGASVAISDSAVRLDAADPRTVTGTSCCTDGGGGFVVPPPLTSPLPASFAIDKEPALPSALPLICPPTVVTRRVPVFISPPPECWRLFWEQTVMIAVATAAARSSTVATIAVETPRYL